MFEVVVDDYAEVWVDGKLSPALGQSGGAVVRGFNAPNRVVLTRDVDGRVNAADIVTSVLQFGAADYSVKEGSGAATITVVRTAGGTLDPVTVNYRTSTAREMSPSEVDPPAFASASSTRSFGLIG